MIDQADVLLVLGSQNSSNSKRLKEIGSDRGKSAFLIDGASEIQPSWFGDNDTVVITAGASAPEVVVEECIDYLVNHFNANVEEITLREENVHFKLPKELMQLGTSDSVSG